MDYTVGVIITTFNSAKHINLTLNSVFNQTYQISKVIVVDDHSDDADDLIEIIKKIKQNKFSNIELIINSKNYGPGYSRNLAWSKLDTDLICFLDDDDYWYKNKIKTQIEIFTKNPNTSLVAGKKKILNKKLYFLNKKIYHITFLKLIYKNFIATSSVVIKSNIKFRFLNQKYAEDYYLWLNIVNSPNNCYLINDYLCEEISGLKKNHLSHDLHQIKLSISFILSNFYTNNFFKNLIIFSAKLINNIKLNIKIVVKKL